MVHEGTAHVHQEQGAAEAGTPTSVTRFDGARVPATDYHVVQGAEAVRSVVTYIRTLYDDHELNFAGPYGERFASSVPE